MTYIPIARSFNLSTTEPFAPADLGSGNLILGTFSSSANTGQIWYSSDSGRTWISAGRLGSESFIRAVCRGNSAGVGLAFSGNLTGSGSNPGNNVYRTTDYGHNWGFVTALSPVGGNIDSATLLDNGYILACGTEYPSGRAGSIYRSTDNGLSWTRTGTFAGSWEVGDITDCGGGVVVGNMYPGAAAGITIIRSTDYGATWTTVTTLGSSTSGMANYFPINGVLLVGDGSNRVWRSTDRGLTFTSVSTSLAAAIGELNDGTMLAAAGTNIYSSSDGGITWTLVQTIADNLDAGGKNHLVTDSGTRVVCTTSSGWMYSEGNLPMSSSIVWMVFETPGFAPTAAVPGGNVRVSMVGIEAVVRTSYPPIQRGARVSTVAMEATVMNMYPPIQRGARVSTVAMESVVMNSYPPIQLGARVSTVIMEVVMLTDNP